MGNTFDFGTTLPILISVALLLGLGILFFMDARKRTALFTIVSLFLIFSIGITAVSIAKSKNTPSHYTNSITNRSHTWQLKITETLKQTSFSRRYIAEVIGLNSLHASEKILLNLPIESLATPFKIDDELVVYATLNEVNSSLNPHQFDYKTYLKTLGITHQLQVATEYVLLENPSRTIYGRAASLRELIIDKLKKTNFGEAELSIMQALLLGQRNDISEATYNDYKNAGAVHILAVSGLHIGVFLVLLQFLFKPLERHPRGKTIKLIIIVTLLWGFALLAGFSASIVRAVTMFTFVAYALYLNRPSNTFNILALSMFFILLVIDPKLLFQVGFQMSYAAVFAIVWIYPLLQKLWFPKNKIVRKVWQLLSVSVAAQLGVLPISLFYFHQFPGLFFISNLVIVPALGIILGGGILVIVLALLNALPLWLVAIYDWLIRTMNNTIAWVADQEAFVFQNISFDGVQLVLSYTLLFCTVLFLSKPNFKKALVVALALITFQSYIFYTTFTVNQKQTLILAHQTRNSILMQQSGKKLLVFAQDTSRTERLAKDYRIGERIKCIENNDLKNSYNRKNKIILRIDSMGIVPNNTAQIDYLLLTQSPKLNLERLLDSLQPKTIIADGSNYKSYIARWEKTCAKRKLPFYYTGEKGAYYFE